LEASILGRRRRESLPETVSIDPSNLHMHISVLLKRDSEHREFNVRATCILRESGGISVDIVRKPSDMPKTSHVAGLEGNLIHRPNRQFCEVCDMISDEVMNMGISLFDEEGRMEDPLLETVTNHEQCNSGGLLYITSVDVNQSARGKDIGLIFLHEVLKATRNQWTLAVMFPAPLHYDATPGVPFAAVVESMSRYFARTGFVQVHAHRPHGLNKYWVLERALLPEVLMSKADAASIVVSRAPPQDTGTDNSQAGALATELVDAICKSPLSNLPASDADMECLRSQLRDIVSRGGDVNAARCLHFAVANQKSVIVHMLVDEFGAKIDLKDSTGHTALHCAASTMSVDGMKTLIELGADKRQKSNDNETPVAMLKKSKKDMEKMFRGVGLLKNPNVVVQLKTLDDCIALLA
jgi:hypothetical protein